MAGGGRPKPQAQTILWGASLVQKEKLEFWKWCFGERSYSSLERVPRGEEDGVVVGGQGGVVVVEMGKKVMVKMGCFDGKRRKKMVVEMVVLLLEWRRRWRREW